PAASAAVRPEGSEPRGFRQFGARRDGTEIAPSVLGRRRRLRHTARPCVGTESGGVGCDAVWDFWGCGLPYLGAGRRAGLCPAPGLAPAGGLAGGHASAA